jgi:PTS system mannose-specific IIC component
LVGLALAAIYVMNQNNKGMAQANGSVVYEDDEEVEIDD